MAYCTLEDIIAHIPEANLVQLTDDAGSGTVDNSKVLEAIAYADQLIDGYLRGRYTVPLDPVPGLIRKISVDLAVFHLYSRRFELEMPEPMMARYKNAIKVLEQIQKGLIKLGIELAETAPGQGYYKSNKTPGDRIFKREVIEKF